MTSAIHSRDTDAELGLRFALLELEGELEARAAEAWARSLSAKKEAA